MYHKDKLVHRIEEVVGIADIEAIDHKFLWVIG